MFREKGGIFILVESRVTLSCGFVKEAIDQIIKIL